MKHQIVLSGVGGQGLVSMGEILGQAATVFEGKKATLTAAYGSETRGTFTKSDVIISDEEIYYPNIEVPDIILCLAQVAYDRYVDKFTDDTLVFYDVDMVKKAEGAKGVHIGFPFREISIEMGNMNVANSIAMGAIIQKTGVLKKDSVLSAFAERFSGKQKVLELNVKALEKGIALQGEQG
jgi:2-oxoglutarate ferredoxin oxidoreductase subunit gamma